MSMEVTVETWRFNFFSKLVDRRLWATISRKIFYADDDFFLKLGCKRQVLSELRIQTTLIFSLSFDKVFYFCVPLSIRWWNQHWVEKQHHFVVVQERTFWREKTASTFWREKWLFLFSGFKAKAFAVLPIFWGNLKGQNRWPVQIYSQKDESFLRPLRNTFTRCLTLIPSDKFWRNFLHFDTKELWTPKQ